MAFNFPLTSDQYSPFILLGIISPPINLFPVGYSHGETAQILPTRVTKQLVRPVSGRASFLWSMPKFSLQVTILTGVKSCLKKQENLYPYYF